MDEWLIARMSDVYNLMPDRETGEYEIAVPYVNEAFNHDLRWQKWWEGSGLDRLELLIHFTEGDAACGDPSRTQVRRTGRNLRLRGARERPGFGSENATTAAEKARGDILSLLDVVRVKRNLSPVPGPPQLPQEN